MGDRVNIVVQDAYNDSRVYLYGHWLGQQALSSVIRGLESSRVGDAPYLARIIFQAMLGDDQSEQGFGISATLGDNNHPILVLRDQEVWFEDENKNALCPRLRREEFLELARKHLGKWDAFQSIVYEVNSRGAVN